MLRMRKKRATLNDVVPDWKLGNGVMATLTREYTVPWKDDYDGSELLLDISYQGGHSGNKFTAPLLDNFIAEETNTVSNDDLKKICGAIWATYRRKWEKLWQLYKEEYDPLHNYDIYEDTQEGVESLGTKTGTVSVAGTETLNTTDTTTKTGTVQSTGTDTLNTQDATIKTGTVNTLEETTKGTIETKVEKPGVTDYVNQTDEGTETRNLTKEDTGTQTTANTGTQRTENTGTKDELETKNLITTTTTDNDTSSANNLFGFNSTTAVPSDTSSGTSDTTETVTETGTDDKLTTDNLVQNRTDNLSAARTDNLTHTDFGTVKNATSESIITRHEGLNTATVSWGGNDITDTLQTNNLVDTTNHTGTVQSTGTTTNNLTDTLEKRGTISDSTTTTNNLSDTDKADRTLESHKYGNIGVASIQRMFKEEVENWKWTFMLEVFGDVDSLLVLAVH